jgi:hypothetical protein
MRRWITGITLLAVVLGLDFTGTTLHAQRLLDRPRDRGRNYSEADGPKETEVVEKTVALPANGTLAIKNFSGAIRITPSSGRNIVLKATRRAPRETLDHVKLDVQTTGSTVSIEANEKDANWSRPRDHSDVVETEMEIQVPVSADLDIDAFSSAVTVEGIDADQRIKTFSGTITVRGLKGEIDAETFSADIRVTLAGGSKGNVTFDSFSGRLDSSLALTTQYYDSGRRGRGRPSRNIEGTLPGGAGPRLRFHTFSGDVELRAN